jgi:hypothetical protein
VNVYDGLTSDWNDITFHDPNMDMVNDPYEPGVHVSTNLLTDTEFKTWEGYTLMGATAAVLGVSLTGPDQIDIESGKTYIVEFELPEDFNSQLLIGRNTTSHNYADGQAFRSRRSLNGAIRDIAMAFTISSGTTPVAGDFTENGTVDSADLERWKTGFPTATSATHGNGDADADGDVDGADFIVWQQQVGTAPLVAAVPEPAAGTLVVVALLAGVAASRKRPLA